MCELEPRWKERRFLDLEQSDDFILCRVKTFVDVVAQANSMGMTIDKAKMDALDCVTGYTLI